MLNPQEANEIRNTKVGSQEPTIKKELENKFSSAAAGIAWQTNGTLSQEVPAFMLKNCDLTQNFTGEEPDLPYLMEKLGWLASTEKDAKLQDIKQALENDPTSIGPSAVISVIKDNWEKLALKQVTMRVLYALSKITQFEETEETINELKEILK